MPNTPAPIETVSVGENEVDLFPADEGADCATCRSDATIKAAVGRNTVHGCPEHKFNAARGAVELSHQHLTGVITNLTL